MNLHPWDGSSAAPDGANAAASCLPTRSGGHRFVAARNLSGDGQPRRMRRSADPVLRRIRISSRHCPRHDLGIAWRDPDPAQSWAMRVGVSGLGGVQLLCIGILGEYVAKIYGETKGRPRYLIENVERRTDTRRSHHSEISQLTCVIIPIWSAQRRWLTRRLPIVMGTALVLVAISTKIKCGRSPSRGGVTVTSVRIARLWALPEI